MAVITIRPGGGCLYYAMKGGAGGLGGLVCGCKECLWTVDTNTII